MTQICGLRWGSMCPPEHYFQDQHKQRPALRQQKRTVLWGLITVWIGSPWASWLSHLHGSKEGQEGLLRASPFRGLQLSAGEWRCLSETWGLHCSKHVCLRCRWEGGFSSFLTGKEEPLTGNAEHDINHLPHSFVSVEINSKPWTCSSKHSCKPLTWQGQQGVRLPIGKKSSRFPHRRQLLAPTASRGGLLVASIPWALSLPLHSCEFLQEGSGLVRVGLEESSDVATSGLCSRFGK